MDTMQLIFAQAGETSASAFTTLWDYVQKGGFMMWPLLVLSLITLGLILYAVFSVRSGNVVSDSFMDRADELLRDSNHAKVLSHCSKHNQSISHVLYRTVDFAANTPSARFSEVREVAEAEGSRQAGLIGQRVSYLADMGAIAPMCGLLGTVFGMIESFQTLGSSVNALQSELSGGVAKALITTAMGLMIGIVALLFYSFLRSRSNRLVSDLDSATAHLLALLAVRYEEVEHEQELRESVVSRAEEPAYKAEKNSLN